MTVQQRRDDASVEEAETVAVKFGRRPGCGDTIISGVRLDLQTFCVMGSTAEAGALRVILILKRLLYGVLSPILEHRYPASILASFSNTHPAPGC